ncbi:GrpB family protein [Arthrobacter sp. 92]|uniref:GrpB family protein n=1 Tax=Arthrobacter sp. 92 TaxID=3418175 RepID=UPI003D07FEDE
MRRCCSGKEGLPDRSNREVVVHLVHFRGRQWHRRIKFRDILQRDTRARYLSVKREAAASTKDLGAYTSQKAGVVAAILKAPENPASPGRRPVGDPLTNAGAPVRPLAYGQRDAGKETSLALGWKNNDERARTAVGPRLPSLRC